MYTLKCPICQHQVTYPSEEKAIYLPFCSKRCKLIDLGRWLNEEYRIIEELPHSDALMRQEKSPKDRERDHNTPTEGDNV
ncbi:MAG: DNA gyrase inhibitor YacG [Planctomycetota bacterium]|nr:MAG: DNA gyrase inhibitor YacG [Planctomycetota bacterium]